MFVSRLVSGVQAAPFFFSDLAYFWSRLTLCGSSVEKKI